jgi:hypothetical protein
VPKEELPKRYFISAIFKFIPSRNCWGWVEDIEPPTDRIPKYEKPVKTVATANQQTVKRLSTETGIGTGVKKNISSKRVDVVKEKKIIAPKPKPLIRS